MGGNGGKRKKKTRFVFIQNREINRSLDFQISGPISKAISGPIKIMVNQVHYPYSGNLSLSLSSSLSNKWVNKWANKWQIRRTVNDPINRSWNEMQQCACRFKLQSISFHCEEGTS